ncbi:hypothetical protein K492DRAFT_24951 [Lichtheimia hyalospora FSU 10163]|nr:hypothetical protein K492DRAFT_24951 [Lichtheimia hyalospora FSU 10163]
MCPSLSNCKVLRFHLTTSPHQSLLAILRVCNNPVLPFPLIISSPPHLITYIIYTCIIYTFGSLSFSTQILLCV